MPSFEPGLYRYANGEYLLKVSVENTQGGAGVAADVNISKINNVTPLMGAGNTGTGSLRVTIASDQATITTTDAAIYTEGDTDATITGVPFLWEDTSNTLVTVNSAKPLPVNIISGSTAGTQYTEGDTDATITGVAMLHEIAADTLATISDANPLQVQQAALTSANDTVTAVISGTPAVTATGNVAHDAADSGSPLKVGGRARLTNRADVADGDRTDLATDARGGLLVSIGQVRGLRGSQRTVIANTAETTVVTQVSSIFHDLRGLLLANGSTTDVDCDIRDDTGGAIITTFSIKAGATSGAMFVQAVPQTATNKNWTAQLITTPSGGNAHVVVTAFYDTNV